MNAEYRQKVTLQAGTTTGAELQRWVRILNSRGGQCTVCAEYKEGGSQARYIVRTQGEGNGISTAGTPERARIEWKSKDEEETIELRMVRNERSVQAMVHGPTRERTDDLASWIQTQIETPEKEELEVTVEIALGARELQWQRAEDLATELWGRHRGETGLRMDIEAQAQEDECRVQASWTEIKTCEQLAELRKKHGKHYRLTRIEIREPGCDTVANVRSEKDGRLRHPHGSVYAHGVKSEAILRARELKERIDHAIPMEKEQDRE